jgi:hypothetical protein
MNYYYYYTSGNKNPTLPRPSAPASVSSFELNPPPKCSSLTRFSFTAFQTYRMVNLDGCVRELKKQ